MKCGYENFPSNISHFDFWIDRGNFRVTIVFSLIGVSLMLITQVRNFPLAYHVLKTVEILDCLVINPNAGEELHDYVEAFCDNMDSSVTLPDIGTWVAVRVTAIFNPGHFWVQFPYGTEPIEKRIMAGMFLVLLSML